MDRSVRHAVSDDVTWAEALTRANMHVYRSTRGWGWSTEGFLASWRETENFVLLLDACKAGFLRFTPEEHALYIRDIQVFPQRQRQGVGTFAVQHVERLARERGMAKVRLR